MKLRNAALSKKVMC